MNRRERLTTDKTKIFIRENPTLMSVSKSDLRNHYNEIFDRLQEYEVESESGNLLELPVSVGDTVWIVYSPKFPANPADKGKWFMLQNGVNRILYGAKGLSIETWSMGTISAKEIGRKLFLTREEAENALKEMGK